MENPLEDFRKSIDLIDDSLINLLAERLRVVEKVGRYKKEKGLPPLDAARFQKVLTTKMEKAQALGLNPELVKEVWNTIHKYALELENKI